MTSPGRGPGPYPRKDSPMARHARPLTRDTLVTRYTRVLNTDPTHPGAPFTFAQVWDDVERLTDDELLDRCEVAEAIDGPLPRPRHLTTTLTGIVR